MIGCRCTQMSPFRQPGRTKAHPENAGGLFVIASGPSVRVGQFGAHHGIAPADLLRSLGVDGFGLDQAIRRVRTAGCSAYQIDFET